MSKYLVMGLEGDFQSYGTDSKYYMRETDMHPSKSAVVGMLLASMGEKDPGEELLGGLTQGYMEVAAYRRPGACLTTDFHMMGSGHDTSVWDKGFQLQAEEKTLSPTKMSWRKYLCGYKFLVSLELEDELAERVADALQNPKGSITLGRKNCLPSAPLFRRLVNTLGEAREEVLHDDAYRKVCVIKEGRFPDEGDPNFVNDVPATLGVHKQYMGRHITIVRIPEAA